MWGRGATGSAVGCTFQRNFFGAYTNAAVGVVFRRNMFRDNDLNGLDPHTNSTICGVDGNVAFRNGGRRVDVRAGVAGTISAAANRHATA